MNNRIQRVPRGGLAAVVLSSGGSAEAYDILRALGREGVRASIAVPQRHNIALYSRYCSGIVRLPAFEESNYPEIVRRLTAAADEAESRPVLFYVSDPELAFVWKFQRQLGQFYRFLLPPENVLASVLNKVKFAEFAKRFDLPVPETRQFRNADELAEGLPSVAFPCIVKPAYTHDWRWDTDDQRRSFGPYKMALRRFTSAEELMSFCRKLPDRNTGFVLQAYLDGRDEAIVSFHGYFDEQSRCLGYFLGRKIRTYPPHTGGSVYVRTIHDAQLAASSIAYLQRIRYSGIVKIDYKWDAARERFAILEINPRYNLWELLGAHAGANLAAAAFRHQSGGAAGLSGAYSDNARLIFVKQDFRAFLGGYRATGEWTLLSYLRSFNGITCFRVWQANDPLPWCVSAISFIVRNLTRCFTALRRTRARAVSPRARGPVTPAGLMVPDPVHRMTAPEK